MIKSARGEATPTSASWRSTALQQNDLITAQPGPSMGYTAPGRCSAVLKVRVERCTHYAAIA